MKQIFNPLSGKFDAVGNGVSESAMEEALQESATYTNDKPTPATIGGIPAGRRFSEPTLITKVLDELLYPYIAPAVVASATNTTREKNVAQNSVITLTVTEKSLTITSAVVKFGNEVLKSFDVENDATIANGKKTFSYTVSAEKMTEIIAGSKKITWIVGDGQSEQTGNISYTEQYKAFYWFGTQAFNDITLGSQSFLKGNNPKVTGTYKFNINVANSYMYFAIASNAVVFKQGSAEVTFDQLGSKTYNGLTYYIYKSQKAQNVGSVDISIA